MTHYIDGFVLPVLRSTLDDYRRLAEKVAAIWKEHGAIDYQEYVSDELTLEGTRSFAELAAAAENEVVVFGWVVFESREARDSINEKVAADERMPELMATYDSGFDAARMAYGAFRPLGASDAG